MTDVAKSGVMNSLGNWITPKCRASFVHVFRPQGMKGDPTAKQKFSITLLFAADADFTLAKKMIREAAVAKWGEAKLKDVAFQKRLRLPFRDQGEKSFPGYEAGSKFLIATADRKPGLVDAANADILDEEQVYSGCYVRCALRAFAYEAKGNVGVAFGLQHVQKLSDGEPLGNRTRAADNFDPVTDTEGAPAGDPGNIFM